MRIAIVDDDPVNLQLVTSLVRKTGDGEPVPFQNPLAGLLWCTENEVDLLIVDFQMPEIDGISFIRSFRELPDKSDTPILMVTGDQDRQTRYEALQCGATDFLTKPVDAIEFRARLRNMLALRHSQRLLADRAAHLAVEVAKATAEIARREDEMITRLSRAAEFRDPETGAHILRMARYSHIIAVQMGLRPGQCDLIMKAAPMHDIGKVAIPDHILLKPGQADPRRIRDHEGARRDRLPDPARQRLADAAHRRGHRPFPPREVRRHRLPARPFHRHDPVAGPHRGGCRRVRRPDQFARRTRRPGASKRRCSC